MISGTLVFSRFTCTAAGGHGLLWAAGGACEAREPPARVRCHRFFVGVWNMKGFLSEDRPVQTLRNVLQRLQDTYCGTIGYEVPLPAPPALTTSRAGPGHAPECDKVLQGCDVVMRSAKSN